MDPAHLKLEAVGDTSRPLSQDLEIVGRYFIIIIPKTSLIRGKGLTAPVVRNGGEICPVVLSQKWMRDCGLHGLL